MTTTLRELWGGFNPAGFAKGWFMVLPGYMDESYSAKMFTYSCLLGRGTDWGWITSKWKARLREKNKALRKQGRQQLSRYHASDCSNHKREFKGWDETEQIDFVKPLVTLLGKYPLYAFAYSLPMEELLALVPTDMEKARKNAYVITLCFLMIEIGAEIHKANPTVRMNLFHDRGPCDTLILDTFNVIKDDPLFRYRDMFISITPMSWEDCIPLQPADMCAYEAFKESCRLTSQPSRDRRKALDTLIKMGHFGVRSKIIIGDRLVQVVEMMKSHNKLFL